MLRSRRSAISGVASSPSSSSRHDDDSIIPPDDSQSHSHARHDYKRKIYRRLHHHRKRIVVGFLIYSIFSSIRFYRMLVRNMTVIHSQQSSSSSSSSKNSLRSNNHQNGESVLLESHVDSGVCPPLPSRLQEFAHKIETAPFQKLTEGDFQRQLPTMLDSRNSGTTGNRILVCPQQPVHYKPCTGVVKVYRYPSVYFHVKYCLTLLQNTGIVPRILYADDATHTLVEEDLGRVTMMNSKIPLDFDLQLRRIRCILQRHRIIHRDITWRNFIVDMEAGFITIIDFGDAFLWGGDNEDDEDDERNILYGWRNMINLFNLWWRNYSEERRLEDLIEDTKPHLTGERIWKPEHRWTSMMQNRVGALLLTQQMYMMNNIPGSERF
jgi:hypothetical protein